MLFFFYSVNVSQFILAKLAAKSVMPVGNSTAWNMVSSLMDKCHLTKPLEPETIPSTPSSRRLVGFPEIFQIVDDIFQGLASTSLGLSSLTSSQR